MENRRVVLVTGGAKGIGEGICTTLAQNGFNVIINYKTSLDKAENLKQKLDSFGGNHMIYGCDVSRFCDVKKMYDELCQKYGFIDTVVNNAGVSHIKLFDLESEKDFDEIVNNNLKSVFNVSNIFCKKMIQEKFGRIVNISSIWGEVGASMEVLYSMTKAGIIGLTKGLSKELSLSGILVNAVSPGVIDTDMNKCFSDEEMKDIIDEIPMQKLGSPQQIAEVVEFLTRKNIYITGQNISVNGGL